MTEQYHASPAKGSVLVTGASSGIGDAISRALIEEGFTVYAVARRTERMQALAQQGAHVMALDIADGDSIARLVKTLSDDGVVLEGLVNNAGYGSYGVLEEVPIEEARRQFEVNVFGLMALTQALLPSMRQRGRGRIVNIGSMAGRLWMPVGGWYHATKFALEALSDALRVELRPFGIKVSLVQPGMIRSEWADIARASLEEDTAGAPYARIKRGMSRVLADQRQAGEPEQIARVVLHALTAARPRRRYLLPLHAKILVGLHWLLPTWLYERCVRALLARQGASTRDRRS
ncbi:MAG: oxidoreductase [Pseudomonadota bacterium]|nr:oxidoreductase [Pseudomonadota bacterium]